LQRHKQLNNKHTIHLAYNMLLAILSLW